ncbi:TnsA endonuclease N-terminal domain-containing protein [Nostoc sp.]|uniref:TnsA endonuclease N-terminal domain-containing protein n=1 Tax=Nostoc sp. TaxID=1180 RepID=UPI002FFA35AC
MKEQFDQWVARLQISEAGQKIIEKVRSSEPSRRVGGGSKNVSGRYPSRKMGVTIQFESHRVELPIIYQLEHDEDVLEFYDQPPQIKLDYQASNGRRLGVLHTPDLFVIRTNSAGWEECKTEHDLKKLAEKNPNRYFYSQEDNQWHCPPGEVYANQFGLYYRIHSDREINWVLQRNLQFLEDYYRSESLVVEEAIAQSLLAVVSSQPGITLAELLNRSTGAKSDDIYTLIIQEQIYGYIGLLSHRSVKGNRQRKLPEDTLAIMEKFILEDYETLKQKRMWEVYGALVRACEQAGVITPSYKAFTKEVKRRPSYEQTKKRQGCRAAYQHESFYWRLTTTTPRHGDRPFEIGHIDHTQLDVELVCSRTGRNLGRPWATFLVDAYSRRLLAVYLTFDSPSYRSCLMVLRICVKRHGRLPQIIVVDNGAEFHSRYFEILLATCEYTKKQRPPAKARFGAVCERLFGTSNTQFVHNLLGNTQITRNVRQVTKSVNPKNQAVWTLGLLYEYLCAWAYEVYDINEHPALFQSPRDAFAAGIAIGGSRVHRMIPYDENFQILTLPTTSKGKAKVQAGRGVKINSIYYWSNSFRDPQIENTSVHIKYDPFNIGIAYTFVRGQWVECNSQYYAELQGRSEKELNLASIELRKRYSNHTQQSKVSAKNLAEFLASVEAQEALLEQRSYDAEVKEVFRVIEGGKAITSRNEQPKLIQVTFANTDSQADEDEAIAPKTLVVYEEFSL